MSGLLTQPRGIVERTLTPAERYRLTVTRLQRSLTQRSDQQTRAALALLAQARGELLAELAQTGASGWTSFHHAQLITTIEQVAAAYSRDLGRHVRTSMETDWQAGLNDSAQLARLLPSDVNLSPLGVSRAPLDVAIGLTADLVQRVGLDFRAKAGREVALAVAGGQTSQQAMSKIAALLKTQPTRRDPSLGPIANQSERIVRTEILTAYNVAARDMEQQTAEAVPEVRKYWLTAHDGRVRPAHASAGSRYHPGADPGPIAVSEKFTVDGERVSGPHDPAMSAGNRINCRCVTLLWHPEWAGQGSG